jgi:RND family efflux transporter MFP subunit
MPKTLKAIVLLSILLLALGFVGFRVWQAYEKKSVAASSAAKGAASRVIGVSTVRARSMPVRENIEITGSLKPKEQVDVTSKVTGRVQQINVQVGDQLRRGQVIAELEDAELAQQVRRAEAAREVARASVQQRNAELANAKADAARAKLLADQGLIARQDYESKITAYQVFQAQVALANAQTEQASADLRELSIQLSQMKIVAPLSGSVAQRFVDVGAIVSPATPIVRVVNIATMVTLANVPEKEVSKLRLGSRAFVMVEALGNTPLEGKVARISPVLDPATRTALVEVEIPNPASALRAEMFARVRLDIASTREAVLIPRDALVYRGQQAGVYVLMQDKPVFRAIEAGAAFGDDIEVVANLPAGTTIINRGAAMLQEGDQIKIVRPDQVDGAKPVGRGPQSGAAAEAGS